jgi:hypothetical protein
MATSDLRNLGTAAVLVLKVTTSRRVDLRIDANADPSATKPLDRLLATSNSRTRCPTEGSVSAHAPCRVGVLTGVES